MTSIKLALAAAAVLVVAVLGYLIFPTQNKDAEQLAYVAYVRGDYIQALTKLEGAQDQLSMAELELFRGYVYREMKQWTRSDEAFANAEQEAIKTSRSTDQLEIALNQALNAYLQGDMAKMDHAITTADELNEDNGWLEFFKGLEAYQQEKWRLAQNIWTINDERIPLSEWMRYAFEKVFSKRWITLHLARAQMETGQFTAARSLLEETLRAEGKANDVDIDFLIGLSYLKEARSQPYDAAGPDYKLALEYLKKIPPDYPDLVKEQTRAVAHVKTVVESLIAARQFGEVPFYLSTLTAWGSSADSQTVRKQLVDAFNQSLSQGDVAQIREFTELLLKLVPDETVRADVQERLQDFSLRLLEENHLSLAISVWDLSQGLTKESTKSTQRVANKIASQVLALIPTDDKGLTRVTPYMTFWKRVESDRDIRNAFAQRLAGIATDGLENQGSAEKAIALFQLALSLPEDSVLVKTEITMRLGKLYSAALSGDAIQDLPAIYAVIQALQLKGIDSQGPQEIPRQLVIAEQMLAQGDEEGALRRARWVLTLDPSHQGARLMLGRILYSKANYADALQYLVGVSAPDLGQLEAIAVSQLLSGSEAEGNYLLDSIRQRQPIHPESMARIGLGLLALGRLDEGADWLKQVEHPEGDVLAGLAYVALREQRWSDAAALLKQIPAPINQSEGIQGMIIAADIGLKRNQEAERRLQTLLARRQNETTTASGTAVFQKFDRQVLLPFYRFASAGHFFKEVKKQNETALQYLQMIKDPDPQTRVEKGDILTALGRPEEASVEYRQAFLETIDSNVKAQAVPRLARALSGSGRPIEALPWYQTLFEQPGDHRSYREEYAKLLMTLRRDDLALQQFAFLESQSPLSPSQTVLYVQSLIKDGKFDRAEKVGAAVLEEGQAFNQVQKLQIARAMVALGEQESTWPILKQLPRIENLSAGETVALLQFLMEIGSYAQATSLATHQEALLAQSSEGLLTVADLYLRLGQVDEALKQAEVAKGIDPNDPAVLAFIAQHNRTPAAVSEALKRYKTLAQEKNGPPSAVLRFAESVVRLSEVDPAASLPADQVTALDMLRSMNKKTLAIPESFYLMGQLQQLQKQNKDAIESYTQAGTLSPAYAEPFLRLAEMYQSQGDAKRAMTALDHVTEFTPDNADAWEALAQLYRADGNLYESVTYFQNAIQYRPNKIETYLPLAEVYLELRAPEEAQRVLSHAAKIDPENRDVLTLLLKTLYDPALEASADDLQQLKLERKAAAEALRQIAPKEADQMLSELEKNNTSGARSEAGESQPQ